MWYACIAGSGSGTMVVSRVLVLIFAHDDPYELPTHKRSAFLSVPMRRGPCDHGRGPLNPRSLTVSYKPRSSPNRRSTLTSCILIAVALPLALSPLYTVSTPICLHQPLPSASP